MQDEILIALVKENNCLYDRKHRDFGKHTLTEEKWAEIGKELNVPSEMAKKRWRNIKDRFFRVEKQNSIARRKTAPNYKFAEMLEFLHENNNFVNSADQDSNNESAFSFAEFESVLLGSQSDDGTHTSNSSLGSSAAEEAVIPQSAIKTASKERAFCSLLATQLEDAKLPAKNFRNFKIKVIELLSDEIENVELAG